MKKYKGVLIAAIGVAIIWGIFYFVYQKNQPSVENNVTLTEVQKLIARDIEKDYPKTPREVIKLYNRFVDCYYEMDYSQDELEKLADQAMLLFDDDLKSVNPRDTYISSIKSDTQDYKDKEITIVQTEVCDSNAVEYLTQDGRDIAYVDTSYFIKQKDSYVKTYQTYVLRKDANGEWKILVFYKDDAPTMD